MGSTKTHLKLLQPTNLEPGAETAYHLVIFCLPLIVWKSNEKSYIMFLKVAR